MTLRSDIIVEVLEDPQHLARRAAAWLTDIAQKKAGKVAVALSGGSTPRALYACLAAPPFRDVFPWDRTHWFWGDERFVPPDDDRSNYRMTHEAMLAQAPIDPANIHAVPTAGLTPEGAASLYENELKTFYGDDKLDPARALFDIVLLGLGDDGHTASLFPGTAVLEERDHWVAAVVGAKSEARITMTYPALNSTCHGAFLVSGAAKHDIIGRFMTGNRVLPAARIHPVGSLHLFADRAAAGQILR